MPSEIVFSFGVFFVEDAFRFLVQRFDNLHKTFSDYLTPRYRSSIVRKIGSHLTWIEAQRLHIVWREQFSDDSSSCDENNCVLSSSQDVERCDENLKYSGQLETKIEELEKELSNLQAQVTKILLDQENKLYTDERKLQASTSDNIVSSTSLMPQPQPPPAPPPLPSSPLIQTKPLLLKVKPNITISAVQEDSTYSIIEELSKRPPKLRHVDLSPGGRPIRNFSVPSDPINILTKVLKKRFEAIHSPKNSPRNEYLFNSPAKTPDSPIVFGQ